MKLIFTFFIFVSFILIFSLKKRFFYDAKNGLQQKRKVVWDVNLDLV